MAFFKANWFYLPGSLPMVEQLRWARLIQLWLVYQLLRDRPDLLGMFRRERNETTLSGILFLFFLLLGWALVSCTGWRRASQAARSSPLRRLLVDAGHALDPWVTGIWYQDRGGRFVASLLILFGYWVCLAPSAVSWPACSCIPARPMDDTTLWRRQQSEQQAQLLQGAEGPACRGEGIATEVACGVWNGRVEQTGETVRRLSQRAPLSLLVLSTRWRLNIRPAT